MLNKLGGVLGEVALLHVGEFLLYEGVNGGLLGLAFVSEDIKDDLPDLLAESRGKLSVVGF